MEKIKSILENDGIVLIPSDTIRGLSCLADNDIAIDRINKIKNRDESKTMIILMTKEIFAKYISYDYQFHFDYPTTIIYTQEYFTEYFTDNISSKIIRNDDTIAIRIVDNIYISQIINYLGKPIISTSANISGEPSPINFEDINNLIINQVDNVYHIEDRTPKSKPSHIIKIDGDQIIYIRK